jgi:hypothetical protein
MLPDLLTGGSGRFALLGADAIPPNSVTIQMFNQSSGFHLFPGIFVVSGSRAL